MDEKIFFYTKFEISNKFKYPLRSTFFFPLGFLFNLCKKFDKVIISNVPILFNSLILKYCIEENIPIFIIVDSVIEPIHLSHWPKWKRLKVTGAYQFLSPFVIHPFLKSEYKIVPYEILNYLNMSKKESPKIKKIKIGLTISNTPASTEKDSYELLDYFEKIILYLENNKIDYIIRDRSDFFTRRKFFKNRIVNRLKNQSLQSFFQEITHLITVPGTLTLLGGISKIHVCQIILSNMFCNTPSTFIVTPDSEPKNWVKRFINNKTMNHKFQEDYYDYFNTQNYTNSLTFNLDPKKLKEKGNKFIFLNFIYSLLIWDLRSFLKLIYCRLKDIIRKYGTLKK